MDEKPASIIAFIGKGCATAGCATFIIWFFALSVIVGTAMGDCFQASDNTCPSDHERNMTILGIAVAAIFINVAALVFITREAGRHGDEGT